MLAGLDDASNGPPPLDPSPDPSPSPWPALADDLQLLGLLHGQELTAALVQELRAAAPGEWFALAPPGADHAQGLGLLAQGLAALTSPPNAAAIDAAAIDDLAAEYAAIYLTHAYRAAPTESVWRDQDGLERQAPMFAVREYYRRNGLAVADWRLRSDDHIVSELAFLATLLQAGTPAALEQAATFLRDHLLVWVPAFAGRVARRCRHPFYAGLALVTAAYLQALADLMGEAMGIAMTPPFDEVVAASFESTGGPGAGGGATRNA